MLSDGNSVVQDMIAADTAKPLLNLSLVDHGTGEMYFDVQSRYFGDPVLCSAGEELHDMPEIQINDMRLESLYTRPMRERVAERARSLNFFMDLSADSGEGGRDEEASLVHAQGHDIVEDVLIDLIAQLAWKLEEA